MQGNTQLQMSGDDARFFLAEIGRHIPYLRTEVAISQARNQSIRTLQHVRGRLLPLLDQQPVSVVFSFNEQEKAEVFYALAMRASLLEKLPAAFNRTGEVARLKALADQIRGAVMPSLQPSEVMPWK